MFWLRLESDHIYLYLYTFSKLKFLKSFILIYILHLHFFSRWLLSFTHRPLQSLPDNPAFKESSLDFRESSPDRTRESSPVFFNNRNGFEDLYTFNGLVYCYELTYSSERHLVFNHIFFQKRFFPLVNALKINGFCSSLTDSTVN